MKMVLKENWYTRRVSSHALLATMALYAVMSGLSYWQLLGHDLAATPASVFSDQQYWRLWSSLLVHADLAHFFANTPLFLLFTYLLSRTFSFALPLLTIILGGVMNAVVLAGMPAEVHLLGISGVVHMLGALWLSLHLLIDRRDRLQVRLASSLFLVLMLFLPESYRPEVSYLSHFLGFVLGALLGTVIYLLYKAHFRAAERWLFIYEPEPDFDWSGNDVNSPQFPHQESDRP